MAKNMARIDNNNVVINIEWCSDNIMESEILKNIGDRPVITGDVYDNGGFYRDGLEVLSPFEDSIKKNEEYEFALSKIEAALGV